MYFETFVIKLRLNHSAGLAIVNKEIEFVSGNIGTLGKTKLTVSIGTIQ